MKRRVVILSVVAMASGAWLGAAGSIAGAGGADYHLYFGDLRNHTRFSDGWDGTPKDAFDHAPRVGRRLALDQRSQLHAHAGRVGNLEANGGAGDVVSIRGGGGIRVLDRERVGEIIVNNVDELWNKANFRVGRPGLSRAEVIPVFYDWLASHPGAIGHWPHPGLYGDQDEFGHWTPSAIEPCPASRFTTTEAGWARRRHVHDYEDAYLTALDNGWHVMPAAVSDTHDVDWISGCRCGPCCWPSDSLATISSMRCGRIAATRRWMRTSAFGTRWTAG